MTFGLFMRAAFIGLAALLLSAILRLATVPDAPVLWLAVPTVLAGVAGWVGLRWLDEREQARRVEREQAARAARQVKERRQQFLEHASRVLASSPDSQAALTALVNLAVPQIADWCVVDMLREDGRFETLAVAHRDPDKVKLIYELRRTYPLDPNAPGPPSAVRTGRSIVYEEVAHDLMEVLAPNAHQVKIAHALGLHSAMVVPLLVGGRRLGVISLMTAESGRKYVAADVKFAEDLARRAAVAIDAATP